MKFEVMVRDVEGALVVHHVGDTARDSVSRWAEAAVRDPGVPYVGVALDGVHGHLWSVADVEAAAAAGTLAGLVERGRWLRWVPRLAEVLRYMDVGESVTVSGLARVVDGPTEEVREAVRFAVERGWVDPVNGEWSRVARTRWVIPT